MKRVQNRFFVMYALALCLVSSHVIIRATGFEFTETLAAELENWNTRLANISDQEVLSEQRRLHERVRVASWRDKGALLRGLFTFQAGGTVIPAFEQAKDVVSEILSIPGDLPELSDKKLVEWRNRLDQLKGETIVNLDRQRRIIEREFASPLFFGITSALSRRIADAEKVVEITQGEFIDAYRQFSEILGQLRRALIGQRQKLDELNVPPAYEALPPPYEEGPAELLPPPY